MPPYIYNIEIANKEKSLLELSIGVFVVFGDFKK